LPEATKEALVPLNWDFPFQHSEPGLVVVAPSLPLAALLYFSALLYFAGGDWPRRQRLVKPFLSPVAFCRFGLPTPRHSWHWYFLFLLAKPQHPWRDDRLYRRYPFEETVVV
jgi:hypothetical protein